VPEDDNGVLEGHHSPTLPDYTDVLYLVLLLALTWPGSPHWPGRRSSRSEAPEAPAQVWRWFGTLTTRARDGQEAEFDAEKMGF